MLRSAKPRWTVGSIAAALFLSLALHGLLLLVLWTWPVRTASPTLSIQSTRITLDACVLDSRSSTLLPAAPLPADLLGPNVDTTLVPRLEGPSQIPPKKTVPSEPRGSASGSQDPLAHARGSDGCLFPVPATAASVVFVLDRSMSMAFDRKLDFARRELIAALRQLPRSMRFQVIDYNEYAEMLIVDGRRDLLPAEPDIVDKAVALLQAIEPAGASRHLDALCRGIDLRPEVIYFLTDADDLKPEVVSAVTRRNRGSILHTIELTRRRSANAEGPLAHLAVENGGTYRPVVLGDERSAKR